MRTASRRQRRLLAVLTALAVLTLAAVLALSRAHHPPPGRTSDSTRSSGGSHQSGIAARTLVARARRQAAAWVSHEVSSVAVVGCDPAMCAALQAAGIPANRVLVLGPGRSNPLGSDVVMASAAVRNQLGSRLADVYAPVVLATFGAGPGRIDARVVAPEGASDYLGTLSADVRARAAAGYHLAHNARLRTTAAARAQLSGGLVDSRLLAVLAALAARHPLDVAEFGDLPGPAASPGVPLRAALLAWAPHPRGLHRAALRSLRDFLRSRRAPYRPLAVKEVTSAGHATMLRVEYPAPSPLGLLESHD